MTTRAQRKYKFEGISRSTAIGIFAALSSSQAAFLTRGVIGMVFFYLLQRIASWLANQGLAILNIGVDALVIAQEKKDFDRDLEEALRKVQKAKRKLTPEEQEEIDEPVRRAMRRFGRFN